MPGNGAAGASYGDLLVTSLIVLGGVCVAAFVVVRLAGRFLATGRARGSHLLDVVARIPLEPRRSLYIVEVAGKTLLLGTSEMGLSVLSDLDPREVRERVAERPSFGELVRTAWLRRRRSAEHEPMDSARRDSIVPLPMAGAVAAPPMAGAMVASPMAGAMVASPMAGAMVVSPMAGAVVASPMAGAVVASPMAGAVGASPMADVADRTALRAQDPGLPPATLRAEGEVHTAGPGGTSQSDALRDVSLHADEVR